MEWWRRGVRRGQTARPGTCRRGHGTGVFADSEEDHHGLQQDAQKDNINQGNQRHSYDRQQRNDPSCVSLKAGQQDKDEVDSDQP